MLEKSTVVTRGEDVRVGIMFTKVDKEQRIVSGFATVDNVDAHGDIIRAEASRSAFRRFRGGLREMHQPNAVGTLINFEEIKKYDPESDQVYDGIYVNAKVSKGAPDTWEKVLDGTLKGFSIGGKVKHKEHYVGPDGKRHLIIDEYDLVELSLVDNPANPLTNVLTVQKIGDSYVYPDDDVVEKTLNILLHEESGDVILSHDDERDGFVNIGWTDSADDTSKIKLALDEYATKSADVIERSVSHDNAEPGNLDEQNTDEGGATVATDIEKNDDDTTVDTDVEETEAVEKAADVEETESDDDAVDEVEKAADVDEVADDTEDELVSKVMDAVAGAIEGALAKATDAAKESTDAVAEVQTSFDKSLEQFETKISELTKSFEGKVDALAQRVEEIDSETAVRKSVDIVEDDDDDEDVQGDSIWRGIFLTDASSVTKG